MGNFFLTDWSKWKLLGLVAGIQVISYLAGLYSGHTFWPKPDVQVIQPNYNTADGPTPTNKVTEDAPALDTECAIKGNISGKNKIYHVSGGAFYKRTEPELCFSTEAEAQAAGFIKSSK